MGMPKTTLARVISVLKFPLSDQVRAILNKYGATMLLPGVSGALRFGYQPGNYRESTGQTLAAADQQVGLVVDAARVPGPERVTNGDFSNGTTGWTNNSGIATTFESVIHDGIRCLRVVTPSINGGANQVALISGGRHAVSYRVKVISGSIYLGISGNEIGGVRNTTNSGSWTTVTHPAYGATNSVLQVYALSAAEFYVTDISVRELPSIHASQSTSGFQPILRNTSGIQSWQFDGTDDRLSLSAVPFQMADDHFVVAGFRNDSKAALRAQFSVSGSDQTRIAQVYTSTNGGVRVVWRDGSGSVQNEVVSSVDVTGTAVVASGAKRLGRLIGRLDCAQFGDIASGAFGASNPIAASVGANSGVIGFFANGQIHGVIFGKGAITDSELMTLERFIASLQGRTL